MGDSEVILRTYQPAGALTKDERERADRLDLLLQSRIPEISMEAERRSKKSKHPARRWFILGQLLREIVDNHQMVSTSDVTSGYIWDAVWQYIPDDLKPARSSDATPYSEKRRRRKDHLTLCYEIAQFKWADVRWMKRWNDWYEIASRPGLTRDIRVLKCLGRAISGLKEYPSGAEIREIAKTLAASFPTKQLRDSSSLSDEYIEETVHSCIQQVLVR